MTCRDVQAVDGAINHLERYKGLVEGDFVTGFVDADERESACCLDLAMYYVIGRSDVDEAGRAVSVGWNVRKSFGEGLATEPVTKYAC